MTIQELIGQAHSCAVAKGWWDKVHEGTVTEKLLLIHSEISEAVEEIRNGHGLTKVYYNESDPDKPEGFGIEVADAIIRAVDLCHQYGVDVEECLRIKLEFNRTRPYRHGGKEI